MAVCRPPWRDLRVEHALPYSGMPTTAEYEALERRLEIERALAAFHELPTSDQTAMVRWLQRVFTPAPYTMCISRRSLGCSRWVRPFPACWHKTDILALNGAMLAAGFAPRQGALVLGDYNCEDGFYVAYAN